MKHTLTLLIASTALACSIGIPSWSAIQTSVGGVDRSKATLVDAAPQTVPLLLASDDGGDNDGHWWKVLLPGHDDDDNHNEDDDDDNSSSNARNPAAAGTVDPPQSGLFSKGSAPQVKVN